MSKEQGSESAVSGSELIKEEEMAEEKEAPKRVSRRQFVKGAAAVAGAGALASCAPPATPAPGGTAAPAPTCPPAGECPPAATPWIPAKWDYEADVVVVGFGLAGAFAAIEAHDAGSEVLLLEKAPERFAGGNSAVSGGNIGVPSDASDAVKLWQAMTFGTTPEDLLVAMAEAAVAVPGQLDKLGIELVSKDAEIAATATLPALTGTINNVACPGGCPEGVAASMAGGGKGTMLFEPIKAQVEGKGIGVKYETPATGLVQDPSTGEILGVVAEELGEKIYVQAKRAVVLACGGHEANREMLHAFNWPALAPYIYPRGTPYNTGDGLRIAQGVGASLWNMTCFSFASPCLKAPSDEYGFGLDIASSFAESGYIYVNRYGKRFMDEKVSMSKALGLGATYWDKTNFEYPNVPFYIIFTESFRLNQTLVPPTSVPANMGAGWNQVHKIYEWSPDNSEEVAKGWIVKADTLTELATKLGVDPAALQETVTKYNEYCALGQDAEFARPEDKLIAIDTPPYYGAEFALTVMGISGGPKHNAKSQTLDEDGEAIPRLYSVGELGSFRGFGEQRSPSCFSALTDAMASGSIGGKNAAAETPWE
jgi:succinate dehydrogenase/fumarate reductase flavoprotein subunit